jgi:hypothetical protein
MCFCNSRNVILANYVVYMIVCSSALLVKLKRLVYVAFIALIIYGRFQGNFLCSFQGFGLNVNGSKNGIRISDCVCFHV